MKKIIFDTDIGYDCDDAGALALLHRLCDTKEAELLAVTACYDSPYVAGCIDAINQYYGRTVPIGVLHGAHKAVDDHPVYSPALCREYPNAYPPEKPTENALSLLRKILSQAEDLSITLVITGSLATACKLLQSKPDAVSPLTGAELIRQKLDSTVVMGGRFFETWQDDIVLGDDFTVTWEWNIKADVPAAQTVCRDWPGKLIFASYEIGMNCISMQQYCQKAPANDPVRSAYQLHGSTQGRSSWDHTTVLEAVRPGQYFRRQPWGKISVEDEGITRYQESSGSLHTYLVPICTNEVIAEAIDTLVLPH